MILLNAKKIFNIILILIISLLIVSCNNKNEDINNDILSYYYDFSYYGFEKDDDICLKASTVSTLKSVIDNKETSIFMISTPTCISCKRAIEIVNDIALQHNFNVYTIDPNSHLYPVFADRTIYDELLNILKPCIQSEDEFVSPIILVINNGSIDSYMVGYEFIDNDTLIKQIDSILEKSKLY